MAEEERRHCKTAERCLCRERFGGLSVAGKRVAAGRLSAGVGDGKPVAGLGLGKTAAAEAGAEGADRSTAEVQLEAGRWIEPGTVGTTASGTGEARAV